MHHHLGLLIQEHGYWISLVGSMFEGEVVLILAGLAAHRGYLHLPLLIALGAVGSFLGDQIFFLIGRRYGARIVRRYRWLRPGVKRANSVIVRFSGAAILIVRFLYGLRTVGPMVIGMSRVPWHTFALFNALGATVWATVWVCAGYLLGNVATIVLGDVAKIEKWLFVAVILGSAAVAFALHLRRRAVVARTEIGMRQ